MPRVFLRADLTFTPVLSNGWGLTNFKTNSIWKKSTVHTLPPLNRAYKVQLYKFIIFYWEWQKYWCRCSFPLEGAWIEQINCLPVGWYLAKTNILKCCMDNGAAEAKRLSGNVGMKQSHWKRETEAHFNQEREYLQQRVPRISVHHTNGIPWAWASTLHLSNIPKLNARPGMAQYSPGIIEGSHLHPSLPKGLPFSTMSLSEPVIWEHIFTSLAVPPPAICQEPFFVHFVSSKR